MQSLFGQNKQERRHWRARVRDLCGRAQVDYRRASHRATISPVARGCSAVGSASPCQGEGRGFESRHPLEGANWHQPQRWSGRVVRQRPAKPCTRVRFPSPPQFFDPARLAQRESASLTRKRSLVQSQYRARALPQFSACFRVCSQAACTQRAQLRRHPRMVDHRHER